MTKKQKIEILEAVIYEFSEFFDKYDHLPEDFSIHESKLQSLLEAIEQEEPEPLDPHTCDLMVGDVAEWGGTRKVVTFIYDDGMLDIASKYSVQLAKRHDLVLTHRNGATIKEVGNE